MAFGQGSVSSDAMSSHKEMAGAKSGGNFGVKPAFSGGATTQPGIASFAAMNDTGRGAGPNVGGRQAAPDHGPSGKSHFKYGGDL